MKKVMFISLLIFLICFGSFANPNTPFVVLIDAGHGGDDAGNISADGISEKEITLKLMNFISEEITKTENIEIRLTRNGDKHVDLKSRSELSGSADLMISLHTSLTKRPAIRGFEIHIPSEGPHAAYAAAFADALKTKTAQMEIPLKSITNSSFYVLKHTQCPTVILSVGMMSNPYDLKLMNDPAYLRQLAVHIAATVREFAIK